MASSSYDLVLYARDRLLKDAPVAALVADKVWYRAPEDAVYPYIAGFETDGLRDDAQCLDGLNVTLQIHVWTLGGIDPLQTAREIAHAVAEALHHADMPLPSGNLLTLNHRGEQVFYDRDGLTGHAVVEFRALFRSTSTPAEPDHQNGD